MTEWGGGGKKASAEFLEEELARTDFAGLICRASRFKGEKYSDAKENKKKRCLSTCCERKRNMSKGESRGEREVKREAAS